MLSSEQKEIVKGIIENELGKETGSDNGNVTVSFKLSLPKIEDENSCDVVVLEIVLPTNYAEELDELCDSVSDAIKEFSNKFEDKKNEIIQDLKDKGLYDKLESIEKYCGNHKISNEELVESFLLSILDDLSKLHILLVRYCCSSTINELAKKYNQANDDEKKDIFADILTYSEILHDFTYRKLFAENSNNLS